jgi:hypothetical protein
MNEVSQLASAMLAIAFAAVMLVAGELYIQSRPERVTAIPSALISNRGTSPYEPTSVINPPVHAGGLVSAGLALSAQRAVSPDLPSNQ